MNPSVADELDAQNARYGPSPAREANLALLRRGASAVVTGQQVGLFLGPLYTLYKAASAIRNARALAEETGAPVVPVFWLQTEDHDLAEIASIAYPGLSLTLPTPPTHRVSIAHLKLPAEVATALGELRSTFGHLPHFDEHFARLSRHYHEGNGWCEAFAGMLAELFSDEGLVLLNPRVPALAALAKPLHRWALTEASSITDALQGRREAVHVRPGSPLSFFHPDGPEGPRYRLDPHPEGGFIEVGGSALHSLPSLLERLEAEPLCFSTSALLRPLLQDSLLSTAAYVGGPGELAYFEQLAPLYPLRQQRMPRIVHRARFRVILPKTAQALARQGLSATDLERPLEELLAERTVQRREGDALTHALIAAFDETLTHFPVESIPSIHRSRTSFGRWARRLGARLDRAQLRNDSTLVEELERLRAALHPGGVPQERVFGMSAYAARLGERAFIECVLRSLRPFERTLVELTP